MVLIEKPLADSELSGVARKNVVRPLRRSVLPNESHVEMPIVGGAFGFSTASCGRPGTGQVKQTIPMNAGSATDEQLGHALQRKLLYFFRAEARGADLCNPNWQIRDAANFCQLLRPIVDLPMIPIKGETVNCNHV